MLQEFRTVYETLKRVADAESRQLDAWQIKLSVGALDMLIVSVDSNTVILCNWSTPHAGEPKRRTALKISQMRLVTHMCLGTCADQQNMFTGLPHSLEGVSGDEQGKQVRHLHQPLAP